MSNTILLKSRQADATGPAASGLKIGELAVNTFDGRIYLGTDTNNASASAGGTAQQASPVGAIILDENNMASDSDKHLATQQSIKKYVDDQVAALGSGDVTAVAAGDGLSGGGTTGDLTLALDLNALGTETSIDQADFIAMVDATDNGSEKITFSNLEDTIFGNVSGDATVAAGGALTIASGAVDNAMLAGSIANSKLSNSTISGVTLGNNLNALTVDDSSLELNTGTTYNGSGIRTISVKDSGITNAMLAGSIAISKLAANDVTIAADSGTSHAIDLGETLTVSGTSNEIETSISNNTLTIGLPDNVTIAGNLTVSGTTTTVSSTTINVADPLVSLATTNNSADAVDIGIYGLYDTSGSQDLYGGLFRDASDSGKWKLFKDNQAEPTTTVNTSGTGYAVGTLVATLEGNVTGNVTGNVSGSSGSCTGNAATATALANARTINGTSFDGTANITLGNDSVTNAMMANNAIDTAQITDSAVTIAKMAPLARGSILHGTGGSSDLEALDAKTSGQILIGDGTDLTSVAVSGDITISNTGVTTIGSGTVHHAMLSDDIISGQDALTSGIATTDELMISDAGTVKRMDISVLSAYTAALAETLTNKTISGGAYST